jgi:dihydrodipicolinate synthase/N-acetylneuraminate lyase
VAASIAPIEGTDIPVLYYHFPGVYNDDFDLLPMLAMLVERCPNVVGAKLAGVSDLKVG